MRKRLMFQVIAFSLLASVGSAYGKGPIDEIVISGGGLDHAIVIKDSQLLAGLDPWRAGFIDWSRGPVAVPSRSGPSYDISFFIKWEGRHSPFHRGDLQLIYFVQYRPGPNGSQGYVYLPGKGDKYSINTGTIIREADDGKWHLASIAFDSLMNQFLRNKHAG